MYARPDNFYVYEFQDSSVFQCLKLTFRDNDEYLFGYVQKDSACGIELARFFQRASAGGVFREEPILLSLRFTEDTRTERCVLIEDFISPRWAYVNKPSDEEGNETTEP